MSEYQYPEFEGTTTYGDVSVRVNADNIVFILSEATVNRTKYTNLWFYANKSHKGEFQISSNPEALTSSAKKKLGAEINRILTDRQEWFEKAWDEAMSVLIKKTIQRNQEQIETHQNSIDELEAMLESPIRYRIELRREGEKPRRRETPIRNRNVAHKWVWDRLKESWNTPVEKVPLDADWVGESLFAIWDPDTPTIAPIDVVFIAEEYPVTVEEVKSYDYRKRY